MHACAACAAGRTAQGCTPVPVINRKSRRHPMTARCPPVRGSGAPALALTTPHLRDLLRLRLQGLPHTSRLPQFRVSQLQRQLQRRQRRLLRALRRLVGAAQHWPTILQERLAGRRRAAAAAAAAAAVTASTARCPSC
eukprot:29023-Chlamydomonas_euryale.AAC.1